MLFLRRHRFGLLFVVLLIFCSGMVVRQFRVNQSKHVELRDSFILLYNKGYKEEPEVLYQRLLRDLETLSDKALMNDYARTLTIVEPAAQKPDNLIWRYHLTVGNEIEKRSPNLLQHGAKIADEEK